jgi:hypothetical protein
MAVANFSLFTIHFSLFYRIFVAEFESKDIFYASNFQTPWFPRPADVRYEVDE